MPFSDQDIRREFRRVTGGAGVAGYGVVDTYGRRDAGGEGVEGHKAKLRREFDERFSLRSVGDRTQNHTGRLRWSAKSE